MKAILQTLGRAFPDVRISLRESYLRFGRATVLHFDWQFLTVWGYAISIHRTGYRPQSRAMVEMRGRDVGDHHLTV